jgi:hypothetical protein
MTLAVTRCMSKILGEELRHIRASFILALIMTVSFGGLLPDICTEAHKARRSYPRRSYQGIHAHYSWTGQSRAEVSQ